MIVSKIYYLHNDVFNTETSTPSKAVRLAREEYAKHGRKSFIYFVDKDKKEVGKVGWQFKIKDTHTGKIFANIYIDYLDCCKDAETLETKHKRNFEIVNEYGERW